MSDIWLSSFRVKFIWKSVIRHVPNNDNKFMQHRFGKKMNIRHLPMSLLCVRVSVFLEIPIGWVLPAVIQFI